MFVVLKFTFSCQFEVSVFLKFSSFLIVFMFSTMRSVSSRSCWRAQWSPHSAWRHPNKSSSDIYQQHPPFLCSDCFLWNNYSTDLPSVMLCCCTVSCIVLMEVRTYRLVLSLLYVCIWTRTRIKTMVFMQYKWGSKWCFCSILSAGVLIC